MKLVLVRHGQSLWNQENRFTGWTDVGLTEKGRAEAAEAGRILHDNQYDFDICYTSLLKRAIHTANILLEVLDRDWLPVVKAWQLNERHYGALQGLDKAETAAKYGEAQVKIWRRSFDVRPPLLTADDPRNPAGSAQYREVKNIPLPLGESLKDTIARTVPYFETVIKPDMAAGKRVVIVAHGNSLRALLKHVAHLSDEAIVEVNIPTGVPLVLELDDRFCVTSQYYLADEAELQEKMNVVKDQGKAREQ
jgi:2,3-bisphosphoglycerate-dependent phosphoglycerate mutase